MARIRTIKPSFFQSEDVAALSYRARLTWIGLWTHADDEGRMKDSPRLIKGNIWPLEDDVTAQEVEKDLAELEEHGRITRYEVNGDRYLEVNRWLDHQKISRPTPSNFPPPETAPNEDSRTTHGGLSEDSVRTHEQLHEGSEGEGKGREGKGKEGKRTESSVPHTIPHDFPITDEMRSWAKDMTPAIDVDASTKEFIDYWADRGDRKKDWQRTWKNDLKKKQGWAVDRGWKPPTSSIDLTDPKNW